MSLSACRICLALVCVVFACQGLRLQGASQEQNCDDGLGSQGVNPSWQSFGDQSPSRPSAVLARLLVALSPAAAFQAVTRPTFGASHPSAGDSRSRMGRAMPVMSSEDGETATAVAEPPVADPVFKNVGVNTDLKLQLLSLAASLDRGQSYNPSSSDAYKERMNIATSLARELVAASPPLPTSFDELDGEWELVFTNVAHGIFRSSPFFLAIQEAYAKNADPPAPEKAELFFKLHELQTCSWGVSKIGRVAQTINAKEGMLYSEFDTNLLSLTVIPILGWFKLFPTFGGCVITASSASLAEDHINMEVQYTTSRPVPGLSGLRPLPGEWGKKIAEVIWSLRVPVGAVWKLLPWNKGRAPTCSVKLLYFDGDMRIVEDPSGDLFVYSRPVAPRPLPADKL